MNIKVSVIIPVYNVEKYLEKCLDSVINQTLRDIEIICINDGSTDKSLEILEEYAEKDHRIKIISQKNRGAGAARNIGLNNAKGKYIAFVDSDDWIELNSYEKLFHAAESKNSEMIFFKMFNYNDKKNEIYKADYYDLTILKDFFTGLTYNYKDFKDKIFGISVSPCNKFYKKSFLENINSRFSEGLIFEDNPFFFKNILNADKILLYDDYLYFRRRIENSVISLTNDSHFDIIPISNLIINVFKDNNLFGEFKSEIFNKKITLIRSEYEIMDDNHKEKFFKLIKSDFLRIKSSLKDFNNNLMESNSYFYLNALKYDNFWEFDLYNLKNKLEHQINFFKQDNINLKNWIIKLEENNKRLESKIVQLDRGNKKLNINNKALMISIKDLKKDKKKITSSKSWKITKPLRYISNFFK